MSLFHFFESLPSTMDEARKIALKGTNEEYTIVALNQTEGRGRRGRLWESSLGNVSLTYITYLNCSLATASQLSFVACIAVGEYLRPVLPPGHSLSYKWPNDLLLNGKKVGGLLLEAVSIPEKKEVGYLIGCGLNLVNHPMNVGYPATSFQGEGIYLSLEEVIQGIVLSFHYYILLWQQKGFVPIADLWMKGAANLEAKIIVDMHPRPVEGIFKGIDKEGAMILQTSQGLKILISGDILPIGQH